MKLSAKHFFLTVVLLTSVASAQVVTGTPPFGSFGSTRGSGLARGKRASATARSPCTI